MLLVGAGAGEEVGSDCVDDRLVGWQDVLPTLLHLAGLSVPDSVQGRCMLSGTRRDYLYGEVGRGARATRMLHAGRFKLIYYPMGNSVQLFDLEEDPEELVDLSARDEHADRRRHMEGLLAEQLRGEDRAWVADGALVGMPAEKTAPLYAKDLSGQRGVHWPL